MKNLVYLVGVMISSLLLSCEREDDGQGAPSGASISGEWILNSIALNADELVTPPAPVNIIISDNFEFEGNATCNQYGGSFSLSGENRIIFESVLSTEMLCEPQALNTFESQYYNGIEQSNTYDITQEMLNLTTADGVTLNFSRAD